MKKKYLIMMIAVSSFFNNSYSQGIPTYDNAVAMIQQQNFIKQLAEMAEQLKIAEAQLNSFKEEALQTQKRLEGYSNFGSLFDIADLQNTLDNMINNIDTSSIKNTLDKYGLNSEDTIKQYDLLATTYNEYENLLKSFKEKDKKLSGLREKFNLAQTPQERDEIANNIALESVALENEKMAIEYQMRKNELEKEFERKKLHEAYVEEYINGGWQGKKAL